MLRLYLGAEDGRAAAHGVVVICVDECGPLSLRPWPGSAWAPRKRPWRTRATYHRTAGVRYLLASLDVGAIGCRVADRAQGRAERARRAQAPPRPLPHTVGILW